MKINLPSTLVEALLDESHTFRAYASLLLTERSAFDDAVNRVTALLGDYNRNNKIETIKNVRTIMRDHPALDIALEPLGGQGQYSLVRAKRFVEQKLSMR